MFKLITFTVERWKQKIINRDNKIEKFSNDREDEIREKMQQFYIPAINFHTPHTENIEYSELLRILNYRIISDLAI